MTCGQMLRCVTRRNISVADRRLTVTRQSKITSDSDPASTRTVWASKRPSCHRLSAGHRSLLPGLLLDRHPLLLGLLGLLLGHFVLLLVFLLFGQVVVVVGIVVRQGDLTARDR